MSSGDVGYPRESRGAPANPGAELLRLISQAVLVAMVEDWTVDSLELYRAFEGPGAPRQLPDDTIGRESPLERELVQWLAGEQYPLDGLAASVRDFLSLGSFGFQSAGGQDGILPGGMGFQGRCCRAGVRSWGCTVVWGGVRDPVCLGYQLGRSTSSWVLPSAPLPGGMGVLYLMVADPRPTWISSTAVSMMALVI